MTLRSNMGLKDRLIQKKRERSLKRNIYNRLLEDAPTTSGLSKKMTLMRKAYALYKNSSE